MAYYKLDWDRQGSKAKYWRNRLIKFSLEQTDDLMFDYQFAIGARKHFADTIFEDLGGHEGWGEKTGMKIEDYFFLNLSFFFELS